ncbi:MAG: RNA polymerase sigma-70 factor, ECF subfamily [Acidimicrobiaceae bacterium]|nr:MAG: RNA polymerase sigma-70 factor, ECF subfamily [Acidimicrobiaceae bacterium]
MNEAVRQHDVKSREGLMALYDDVFDEVHRSATRLTRGDRAAAEDLVQDAFVQLVRAARNGSVDEVGIGWLLTAVRRRHIDRLRSAERENRRLRLVASSPSPQHSDGCSEIASALGGLSIRECTALVLRYVEDLPVAEVAELMHSSVRATESLLQRAKRRARQGEVTS